MNIKNRTMFIGDNVGVLDNINSECVDLIYLDPPFNSNKHYSAPIGSRAAGASFRDAWTLDDIDMAWLEVIKDENKALAALLEVVDGFGGNGDKSYLIFMARRLLEMRRILKSTGSIYLHCDPTMSHSLKLVMDCIFGKANFRNEIVWQYFMGGKGTKDFARKHDVILRYTKTDKWIFNLLIVDRHLDFKPGLGDDSKIANQWRDELGYWSKVRCPDVWQIKSVFNMAKESTGYPTQKPLALLQRIIKASSNEGDVVLDPFCGCATALVAAEELNRQWIGIDLSETAKTLIHNRLKAVSGLWRQVGNGKLLITRSEIPARTDIPAGEIVNPNKEKDSIYGRQHGDCAGCGQHFLSRNLTVDHIVPKSKGGQDIKRNLQLLCGACNSTKGDRDMAYLMAKLKEDAKK